MDPDSARTGAAVARSERHTHLRVGALLAASLIALTPRASAQSRPECESRLERAREDYLRGSLTPSEETTVEASFRACFTKPAKGERKPTRGQKQEAYRLWASALLLQDDWEGATRTVRDLLALSPTYSPNEGDLYDFRQLVAKERLAFEQVSSVSGTPESLRLAPATVIVVTAEEIAHRGYTDIEEILHDLPGFDISRGNGDLYANVYQRGFRSASDRMLFLVDGVEQNDLWSNSAYISRQYPLSNIDRIEVVYGPASTLYGANAYTGVLHVISKSSEELLVDANRRLFATVQAVTGSQDTELLDWTVAGRLGEVDAHWSLTGRSYRKSERNLGSNENWDFDYSNLDYAAATRIECQQTISCYTPQFFDPTNLLEVAFEPNGELASNRLSEEGARLARILDRKLLELAEGSFTDETSDWSLSGKLDAGAFSTGVQAWRRGEGSSSWYTELSRDGADRRTPQQVAFWTTFRIAPTENIDLDLRGEYVRQQLGSDTVTSTWSSIANRAISIGNLASLHDCFDANGNVLPKLRPRPGEPDRPVAGPNCLYVDGVWTKRREAERFSANRFAGDLKINWSVADSVSAVLGLNVAATSQEEEPRRFEIDTIDAFPFPFFEDSPLGGGEATPDFPGRSVKRENVGAFVQVVSKWNAFSLSAGARWDHDRLTRENRGLEASEFGYGSQLSPRAAIVYAKEDSPWTLKLIYAEGFKDPSVRQRFSSEPGVLGSLDLETARNLELAAGWAHRRGGSRLEASAYRTTYSNVVGLVEALGEYFPTRLPKPDGCEEDPANDPECKREFVLLFDNLGVVRVQGLQLAGVLDLGGSSWFANATYTDAVNTDPVCAAGSIGCSGSFGETTPVDRSGLPLSSLPIGDIATYRVNAGLDRLLFGSEDEPGTRLRLHLRANHVGPRETGINTTVRENPFDEIEAVTLLHGTLTLEDLSWARGKHRIDLQLIGRNLLDEEYFDPGVERADGSQYGARIPQERRSLLLKLTYSY